MKQTKAKISYDAKTSQYHCSGDWSITTLDQLLTRFKNTPLPEGKELTLSLEKVQHFDTSGALCLEQCMHYLKQQGKTVDVTNINEQQRALLELVHDHQDDLVLDLKPSAKPSPLYQLGKATVSKLKQADGFIILIGDLSTKFVEAQGQWRRFQGPSILSIIHSAGIQALPIVGLLSFLIGIVLAYQMGLQLQTYGANIFIAYLSGLAIFREFAPLITAIIVAGRTSFAFTAQIGSMIINEEIDALETMGLSPTELLVMPKVLGLLLVFPLLIFWADVFSILGALFMSKWMLDVSFYDFLIRLKTTVGLKQLLLGLYKAPAFAIIIALVGCYQGFLVQSKASSIGSQTTKSVVQALFLIIIADAIFSIVYSWLGV